MPVSLGEWRVRIGTSMRRRRKEYDYHYFWRKLENLIKKTKYAEPSKENNSSGYSSDTKRSSSNMTSQSASSYNINLNTAQTGPSCDINNGRGNINTNSLTLSQFVVPEYDTFKESGSQCDVNDPGHNDVFHSESSCTENSGSSIAKETNLILETIDVKIPVPRPCVEDELDNRHIAFNLMSHEYTPKSAQISNRDKPEVGTSESYSCVHADVPGDTDRINRDKEEPPESRLSGKEDQSGTTSGEADVIKGNDCPNMTKILLLRCGDVEQNPGPDDNPGSLTELELYLIAEDMDPSDFRKVGLALGFPEAKLSQFEKDNSGDSKQATYKMLYEWWKTVRKSKARKILVNTLESIKLVQLADSVWKGLGVKQAIEGEVDEVGVRFEKLMDEAIVMPQQIIGPRSEGSNNKVFQLKEKKPRWWSKMKRDKYDTEKDRIGEYPSQARSELAILANAVPPGLRENDYGPPSTSAGGDVSAVDSYLNPDKVFQLKEKKPRWWSKMKRDKYDTEKDRIGEYPSQSRSELVILADAVPARHRENDYGPIPPSAGRGVSALSSFENPWPQSHDELQTTRGVSALNSYENPWPQSHDELQTTRSDLRDTKKARLVWSPPSSISEIPILANDEPPGI